MEGASTEANIDGNNSVAVVPRSPKLVINPNLIAELFQRGVLGFRRPFSNRNPTYRYYPINLNVFRTAISFILENYLLVKLGEYRLYSEQHCEIIAKEMTHLVVDACVAALYARLRTVHRSIGDYFYRYAPESDYDEDFYQFELPLPFADAIQNFGPFNPGGILDNFVCVPVHPENNVLQNEVQMNTTTFEYEAIIPRLKKLGIPFMSVDTSTAKFGTSWWCFRSKIVAGSFDLCCLYPPSNYSDHAAVLASMFIVTNGECAAATVQLVDQRTDDMEYPVRMRMIPCGFQLRAFAALCHAPSEEWGHYS